MSHFCVMVVGDNVEEQLIPFNENPDSCPQEYLKFEDKEEEYKKEWENDTMEAVNVGGKYFSTYDKFFTVPSKDGFGTERFIPEGVKVEKVSFKLVYNSFEEWLKEWMDVGKDEKNGKYGYWSNPNAKWDWYEIGGRWSGYFTLKNCKNVVNSAKKGDIDFEYMLKEELKDNNILYDTFENLKMNDPETAKKDFYWVYGVHNKGDKDNIIFESKEEFLKRRVSVSTFAVLKDGKWYERGGMGWWGCVSNEKDRDTWDEEWNKLFNSLDNETVLTIVDCHI